MFCVMEICFKDILWSAYLLVKCVKNIWFHPREFQTYFDIPKLDPTIFESPMLAGPHSIIDDQSLYNINLGNMTTPVDYHVPN